MTTWWSDAAQSDDLLALRPDLAAMVTGLRADARARVPGRLHHLLETRVRELLGQPTGRSLPPDVTPAERVALRVAEQLVLDVRGLTDHDVAQLGEHFGPAEQMAILIDLALLDGFAKLDRVAGSAAAADGAPS